MYAARLPGGWRVGCSPDLAVDAVWLSAMGCERVLQLTERLPAWVAALVANGPVTGQTAGRGFGLGGRLTDALAFRLLYRDVRRRLHRWGWHTQMVPARAVRAGRDGGVKPGAAHGGRWAAAVEPAAGSCADPAAGATDPGTDPMDVEDLLAGRLLTLAELHRLARARGTFVPPASVLWRPVVAGTLGWLPGVYRTPSGQWACGRCGQVAQVIEHTCWRCRSRACPVCEACRSMGEVRGCDWVLFDRSAAATPAVGVGRGSAVMPSASRPLTPAQVRASAALVARVQGGPGDTLLHAVCGAGKTEVSFAAIGTMLAAGGRVLFAVPRRDVVVELAGRLKAAFPHEEPAVLYGGAPEPWRRAALTIATTHQVLRFYACFDLVVLDEVDAFPYRGSPLLHFAIQRARRPGSHLILMTATPSRQMIRQAEAGTLERVVIPARHHGWPLPEPQVVIDPKLEALRRSLAGERGASEPQRRGPGGAHAGGRGPGGAAGRRGTPGAGLAHTSGPAVLRPLVRALQAAWEDDAALLVFVPAVALVAPCAQLMRELVQAHLPRQGPPAASGQGGRFLRPPADRRAWVAGSHAGDPQRDAKRLALQAGQLPVLVATTALERGITVARVHVTVLFAEVEAIFSEESLVQVAGRVGRATEAPTGQVLFLASRRTAAMDAAVAQIRSLNDQAAREGLFSPEGERMWAQQRVAT